METISKADFNRMTAGIGVPTKKTTSVNTEAVKLKALAYWKSYTKKVKVDNEDGTFSVAEIQPYKELSFEEIGNVKVVKSDTDGNLTEKEYSAIAWSNGRKAVFCGWKYSGIVPVPNNEGLYMFG